VSVRVDTDRGVIVTLPLRARADEAERALRALDHWVAPRVAALAARRQRIAGLGDAGLPFLGQTLRLEPDPGRTRVARIGDALSVPAVDDDARRRALVAWYRAQTRDQAARRLDAAVATLGVDYARLRITDTRTRWGSCSSRGTISLSWRLLLAPEACLDYVVWHEACHLVHPHHRATFWGLLEQHRPDWRTPSGWLREHGADLRLWLAAPAGG
jgi:predicted metal-dependent hydrolase